MVDEIKEVVEEACKGPVLSCADILGVAARGSVIIVSVNEILHSHNHNFIMEYFFRCKCKLYINCELLVKN